MKTGLEQLDVYVFNAIRLTISAAVLSLLALRERRRGILPGKVVTWRHVVTYSLMVSAVYQLLFLLGMDRTTAGNAALIIATVPMWTALLARVFIGERLGPLAWLGLAVALVGTIIVALQKDVSAGKAFLLGNLIILASAILWAAGTVYSRPLLKHISPVQLSAAASVVALPIHVLVALVVRQENVGGLQSVGLWVIIIYSGVLSSGLAQPMWHFGVRHAGASHAAIIQNLIPLVAVAAAWMLRGVAPTQSQLLGGSLIICGLIVMRLARTSATE